MQRIHHLLRTQTYNQNLKRNTTLVCVDSFCLFRRGMERCHTQY
jgi:hypothetical protein